MPANETIYHAWTGSRYVDVRDPQPEDIVLNEIAVGISREQRYRGNVTSVLWTVGQHSLLCLNLAEEHGVLDPQVLAGILMHDASEYILGDMVRPVKETQPDFRLLEERWQSAIAQRFGLDFECSAIDYFDQLACSVEKKCLISPKAGEWGGLPDARNHFISSDLLFMNQIEVANAFTRRLKALGFK